MGVSRRGTCEEFKSDKFAVRCGGKIKFDLLEALWDSQDDFSDRCNDARMCHDAQPAICVTYTICMDMGCRQHCGGQHEANAKKSQEQCS